jgi:hypothetical protein
MKKYIFLMFILSAGIMKGQNKDIAIDTIISFSTDTSTIKKGLIEKIVLDHFPIQYSTNITIKDFEIIKEKEIEKMKGCI